MNNQSSSNQDPSPNSEEVAAKLTIFVDNDCAGSRCQRFLLTTTAQAVVVSGRHMTTTALRIPFLYNNIVFFLLVRYNLLFLR